MAAYRQSCASPRWAPKYRHPPTALSLEHVLDPRIKDHRAELRRWRRSTLKSWLALIRNPRTIQFGSSGINEYSTLWGPPIIVLGCQRYCRWGQQLPGWEPPAPADPRMLNGA